ncbi:MAG: hypothetical protein SGILL_010501 [Bacillariaceae sp.]
MDNSTSNSSNNDGDNTVDAAASSASSAAASVPLPDPDDGFILSPDDPNHPTNFVKPGHVDKSAVKKGVEQEPQYILGTLIVRVVAAKNLQLPSNSGGGGGLFGGGSATVNPYCSVRFGKSTQRSSEVFAASDPVWPRQETMFMDVSLPESKVCHPKVEQPLPEDDIHATSSTAASASYHDSNNTGSSNDNVVDDPYAKYKKPDNTLLTLALFHTQEIGRNVYNFSGLLTGDSDDVFLGVASIDLTRLFTDKTSTIDKWLPLLGTATSKQHDDNHNTAPAMVRVCCEYEPSDVPPKHGDICRFNSFCHPKDLFPLEPGRPYKVEQVMPNDIVLLSYESQEKWVLTFQAHRNMLICEERHISMLDSAQDELHTIQERLAHSPLVATVTETAGRVQDDGVVGVAEDIAKNTFGLLDRWIKGGVDTVIGDLQHATNFDGRHNPDGNPLELSSPTATSLPDDGAPPIQPLEQEEDPGPYLVEEDDNEEEANPYMPPCPITGFPMHDAVVAADGHSYERAAIERWFQYSDKSPMTGAVLAHKELVPNYGLMQSVQEAIERECSSKPAAELKKPPPGSEKVLPENQANQATENETEIKDEKLEQQPSALSSAATIENEHDKIADAPLALNEDDTQALEPTAAAEHAANDEGETENQPSSTALASAQIEDISDDQKAPH